MSGVRVLVGTRKGAFVLTADEARKDWDVSGPHFPGWEVYHVAGSPADPDRLYASQSSGWFGQVIQRSDDGGKSWEPVGNDFTYAGVPGDAPVVRRHAAAVGVHPRLAPRAVAHRRRHRLRRRSRTPRCSGPPTAARAGRRSRGLREHGSGPQWQPGAGGMCLHTIVLDPHDENRIVRRDLGGRRLPHRRRRRRPGSRSTRACCPTASPRPLPRSATACTTSRCTRRARRRCSCRSTGTSCAATTAATAGTRSAATCPPTSASRSRCTRTSRRRSTSCRSPATRTTSRPTASCASTAAAPAATSGRRSPNGLPQENCYVNVLRDAMAVDSLPECGVYFGTTGGQVYASADSGDTWNADRARPAGGALGRGADASMIRVVLPAHLRQLAQCEREVSVDAEPTQRGGARRAGSVVPGAARHDARPEHRAAPPVRPLLRLRGGSLARVARRAAARRGRRGQGAVPRHRGDGRRVDQPRAPTRCSRASWLRWTKP